MGCWKYPKGWRYQFQRQKKTYSGAWYKTKAEAKAAEAARVKEVEAELKKKAVPIATIFSEIANAYLDWAERKFIAKTYKYKVFVFKNFIRVMGDLPIQEVTITNLEKYLNTRSSNTNYNRHRRELCALLRWAWKRRLISEEPCAFLDAMPEGRFQKKIYTQEETIKILLAAGELRPFFLALYSLAARVGEINRLRWEDVNFEKRTVTLWTRKRTGIWREQVKAMNEDLANELRRLYNKRSGDWVYANPATSKPFVDRRKQLQSICRKAGVGYLGYHAIRHSVASLLADTHKISLPTIQKILGHSRMTTTEKYIHSLGEGEREAAEMLKIDQTMHSGHAQESEKPLKAGGDEGT